MGERKGSRFIRRELGPIRSTYRVCTYKLLYKITITTQKNYRGLLEKRNTMKKQLTYRLHNSMDAYRQRNIKVAGGQYQHITPDAR